MGTLTVFEWISLDGVFDADSMPEWFFPYDSLERRRFIVSTYREADALLMGRETYEMLAPGWAAMTDADMDGLAGILRQRPKYVASAHSSVAHWGETTLFHGDASVEVAKIKAQVGHLMLIGSRSLANTLAEADLVDEYRLLVQPAIVGSGRGLWSEGMRTPLDLVEVSQFDASQLVLRYRVRRGS